jgi:hypothetical protein
MDILTGNLRQSGAPLSDGVMDDELRKCVEMLDNIISDLANRAKGEETISARQIAHGGDADDMEMELIEELLIAEDERGNVSIAIEYCWVSDLFFF